MSLLQSKISDFYRPASLRFHLTAIVLIVAVVVLVSATAYIGNMATTVIESNSIKQLKAANSTLSTAVSIWLETHQNILRNLVSLPDIISMDPKRQKPILEKMGASFPYMYLVSTTDMHGINVARNDNLTQKDYSDRDWFKKVKNGANVTFESLISRTVAKPALAVSMPIRNKAEKIIGVGMFSLNLENLANQVRVTQVGKTGFAYIVDRDNRVIAHPIRVHFTEMLDLSAYPPVTQLRKGARGAISFADMSGQRWRAFVSEIGNGWGIVVQQQEEELLSTRRMLQQVSLWSIVTAVLVLTAITWWVVRRSLKPIELLTKAVTGVTADILSKSDLDAVSNASLNISTRDEIGTLAEGFNKLVIKLQATLAKLSEELAERKQAEVELQRSEGFLNTIVEHTPHPMWISDEKGTLIRANQALYDCFNVTKEELVGKYNIFQDNIFAEQGFMPLVRDVFEQGRTVRFSLFYDSSRLSQLKLDKSARVVLDVTISAVIGTDHRVINAIIQHLDITGQREAEQALASLSLKNEMLLRSASDGIHILDVEGNVIQVNDAFCSMLGYTPDEMKHMNMAQWDAQWSPQELKEKIACLVKNPKVFETRHRRSDNTVIDVEINGAGVEIDGKLMLYASARDISERKHTEELIKRSLKEKETLLREIHHRVKNNMAVVSSLLALQAKNIKEPTVRHLFDESQQRVKSMALVHEKIYQSKDIASINFKDYISSMLQDIMSLYRIDSSVITTDIDIKNIELDLESAVPCGLIVNELLTNAFKYAFPDNRSGVLSIHFRKTDDTYTLRIKDNGVGLPEGFDFKETSTLGLQIVNVLAIQLLGNLQIKSDRGTDAVITFSAKRE